MKKEMKIGNRIGSDHQPIETIIKGKEKGSKRSKVDRTLWRDT